MTTRISIRLSSLAAPITAAADASGRSVSDEIRVRLAESLGVPIPDMPQGFATMTRAQAKRAQRNSTLARRRKAQGKKA